jgi:acetyl-CoA carboxylase biotin carboxyl carrier protein
VPTLNENAVHPDPRVDGAGRRPGVSGVDGLAAVREQALELLARLDRPPRALLISAGGVTLELRWAVEAAAPPAAPAAGPLVTPVAAPAVPAETAAAGPGAGRLHLTSPAVGVFYHAAEPGSEPFVAVGSTVRAGQQIGIVEAMKMMIPVEADRAGRIAAVIKGNGEPVEYGEELFAIEDLEA